MAPRISGLILLFLLFWALSDASADCIVYVSSADGLAVENAPVTLYNHSSGGLLYSNTTDANGILTFPGSCDDANFSVSYAVSSYSSVLSNATVSSPVPIGGYLTGRVQIMNSLGSYLEGQDCSVVALDTSGVVYDFRTICQDKPSIVCTGSVCNYASVSDCAFSDSMGWYYFAEKIDESKNFVYGRNYTLTFTCNGKNSSAAFMVGLERPMDMEKAEAWIRGNTGTILMVLLGAFCLLVLAALALALISKGKRKGKGF